MRTVSARVRAASGQSARWAPSAAWNAVTTGKTASALATSCLYRGAGTGQRATSGARRAPLASSAHAGSGAAARRGGGRRSAVSAPTDRHPDVPRDQVRPAPDDVEPRVAVGQVPDAPLAEVAHVAPVVV